MDHLVIRWLTCDTCDKLSYFLTNVGGLVVCNACLPKYRAGMQLGLYGAGSREMSRAPFHQTRS